jgi:[acyl-carrier-protein] S-malonyltransferase
MPGIIEGISIISGAINLPAGLFVLLYQGYLSEKPDIVNTGGSMPDVNSYAFIFPGQGSQKVGMGLDLLTAFPEARQIFEKADKVLGTPLSKLCFEGPEDELRQTQNAQPALVTMSLACYSAAKTQIEPAKMIKPAFLAGHSLGEYTALAVAGVIEYPAAIFLARERGRLMAEAGQRTAGGMAAILGLEEEIVNQICRETQTWLANINCPGQLVISGAKTNIEKAMTLAKEKGAARALPLQVSGAFHSPLMQSAADGLYEVLGGVTLRDPTIPIIANTSAEPLTSAKAIKEELMYQLEHAVQWQKSVEYMLKQGVKGFVEIGAGNVLCGLIKRIDKNVKLATVGNAQELGNLALEG